MLTCFAELCLQASSQVESCDGVSHLSPVDITPIMTLLQFILMPFGEDIRV